MYYIGKLTNKELSEIIKNSGVGTFTAATQANDRTLPLRVVHIIGNNGKDYTLYITDHGVVNCESNGKIVLKENDEFLLTKRLPMITKINNSLIDYLAQKEGAAYLHNQIIHSSTEQVKATTSKTVGTMTSKRLDEHAKTFIADMKKQCYDVETLNSVYFEITTAQEILMTRNVLLEAKIKYFDNKQERLEGLLKKVLNQKTSSDDTDESGL